MTTVTLLNLLKEYLEEMVAPQIQLQKDSSNDVGNYELVNPAIFTGWVPPKGYLAEEIEHHIPCIVVGMDDALDDSTNGDFNIRLSFATFSPGEHIPSEEGALNYTPSFNGYTDLLNLMDLTKAMLVKETIIKQKMTLEGNIKWGMYQEQPYPYWYGHMTFTVSTKAYPRADAYNFL
jgi:hypothetical protein